MQNPPIQVTLISQTRSTKKQRKIACLVYFSIATVALIMLQPILFSVAFVFGIVYAAKISEGA